MLDLREEIARMFDAFSPEPWVLVEQQFERLGRRHVGPDGCRPAVWLPVYRWPGLHYRDKWRSDDSERCRGVLAQRSDNRHRPNEHGSWPGDRCRLKAVRGSLFCARHMN